VTVGAQVYNTGTPAGVVFDAWWTHTTSQCQGSACRLENLILQDPVSSLFSQLEALVMVNGTCPSALEKNQESADLPTAVAVEARRSLPKDAWFPRERPRMGYGGTLDAATFEAGVLDVAFILGGCAKAIAEAIRRKAPPRVIIALAATCIIEGLVALNVAPHVKETWFSDWERACIKRGVALFCEFNRLAAETFPIAHCFQGQMLSCWKTFAESFAGELAFCAIELPETEAAFFCKQRRYPVLTKDPSRVNPDVVFPCRSSIRGWCCPGRAGENMELVGSLCTGTRFETFRVCQSDQDRSQFIVSTDALRRAGVPLRPPSCADIT
jgi:hypothetical protein